MRISYRSTNVKQYWTHRWAKLPADNVMANDSVYPLKYALMAVTPSNGRILEAGCGAGRILRHFHSRGYDIVGIDFIESCVSKLRDIDPTLQVEVGDITNLRFEDETFRYVLAFGLYHNLQDEIHQAIDETWRVVEHGGTVCASFRADNFSNRLIDWLASFQTFRKAVLRGTQPGPSTFHKLNLTRTEFISLFERSGFEVESVIPVMNMPVLFKFRFFRALDHKAFNENVARSEGYRLSPLGTRLQNWLMRRFPDQICNVYVMIASKP